MKLKRLMAGVICGVILITGDGMSSIVSHAEQNDKICETYEQVENVEETDISVEKSVKALKSKRSYYDNGDVSFEEIYDKNGNVLKSIQYDSKGNISCSFEYEYDTYGNPVKIIGLPVNQPAYTAIYTYVYDSNGNILEEECKYNCENESLWGQDFYDYLNENNKYEYDKNGNRIKKTVYKEDGSVERYEKYEHDSDGNVKKEEKYNSDNSSNGYTLFEYDDNGNCLKTIYYSNSGSTTTKVYEYDKYGNLLNFKAAYGSDDEFIDYEKHEYEYDSDGDVIKDKRFMRMVRNVDFAITEYTLEYYEKDDEADTEDKKTDVTDGGSKDDTKSDETKADETKKDDTKSDDTKPDKESASNPEPIGDKYSTYESNDFYRDEAGDTRCYDSTGAPVINEFKCDGTYTYYFQLDGTAMKDRLSYHPDGEHVIYFDAEGHEVFSDFANVKKTIAGEDVNDFCFFNVFGYMYVDVLTYDKTGTYLYYANPYGVMEMGKWFQFSDSVEWADGTPAEGIAGGYGYANENGTLLTNTQTVDWEGRSCYLQGNGVAAY